jgi:hypothetical protein
LAQRILGQVCARRRHVRRVLARLARRRLDVGLLNPNLAKVGFGNPDTGPRHAHLFSRRIGGLLRRADLGGGLIDRTARLGDEGSLLRRGSLGRFKLRSRLKAAGVVRVGLGR